MPMKPTFRGIALSGIAKEIRMASARTLPGMAEGWQRAQRAARYLIAGCFLFGVVATGLAAPPPTVPEFLKVRPKQDGVNCTVPGADEVKGCTVEPVKGAKDR